MLDPHPFRGSPKQGGASKLRLAPELLLRRCRPRSCEDDSWSQAEGDPSKARGVGRCVVPFLDMKAGVGLGYILYFSSDSKGSEE